ncbi:50S ribosomal protein L21 [Campylobacter pinnipediorum]|uniref:Large ribosomal subunit protein bL21 n=2 Tax=Campylobacter pinnipediorum TaxID=1965231 RepID=A0A1S6U9T7_9BACT|nr:50S ribosomal protein L21 [Campylobacter pinnipediorum]AQW82035.1 50S ribosomal protein L21 [Campylobacter pinnipediorum subsp. pinnipediorum]AQW83713.1 50S ribosomal protein L21 [Campylobacter pinnipediorum subsp. pinnipediorum]AQW85232.1 50S ribosomal protein L21 [Campylobacter pinnipediorum subsp. pinnipediorum]AQW86839.1 50S ribosomal protein L21 [Campylobacter pinnipediorum subsp. caledonicus]AQW88494.1 50S ribosomal protein L21 [Campylobacter pinnipediorum subsp. caledonicus]
MSKYAIIKHGGKQYRVSEGQYLNLDRFEANAKDSIEITDVLAVNDGDVKVGAPFVKGAKVVLEVVNLGKDKKVIIYKKRRRKDSKLKRGFRRQYTRVKVISIAA